MYLLPPALQEWVSEDHVIYLVMDVVRELDLTDLEAAYKDKDPRGAVPYDPRMLLSLLIYGYCTGTTSSRKLESATWSDVATRLLVADQHPDHTVISEFRRKHRGLFRRVFEQVLVLCGRSGLVKLGRVSLDGTKVRADASKHKAMSYDRMQRKEKELRAEIDALVAEADAVDAAEDAQYGKDRRGDELPDELIRRESRLKKIREVKAALEAEAAAGRAEQLEQRSEDRDEQLERAEPSMSRQERRKLERLAKKTQKQAEKARRKAQSAAESTDSKPAEQASSKCGLIRNRPPFDRHGDPHGRAQRNFTDPDSRIMVDGRGAYEQSYNAQAVVTDEQIIIATDVSNQAPDVQQMVPMLEQTRENLGELPDVFLADNGYFSADNVGWCEDQGIDAYISIGKKRWESEPGAGSEVVRAMRAKLETPEGAAHYARRKVIPEPVFGQIKECQGIRRFRLRGLEKVRDEWQLITAAHNLLKLHRARLAAAPA